MDKAKATKFEFPGSGKAYYVPRVSVSTITMRLMRKYPKPMPPSQLVEYGHKKVREFNYSHPDYKLALNDWNMFIDGETNTILFQELMRINLTTEQQAEVDEWKEANAGEWDAEIDSDVQIWFERIAIASDADFMALLDFVKEENEPAEEAVAAAEDGFPGEVSE